MSGKVVVGGGVCGVESFEGDEWDGKGAGGVSEASSRVGRWGGEKRGLLSMRGMVWVRGEDDTE